MGRIHLCVEEDAKECVNANVKGVGLYRCGVYCEEVAVHVHVGEAL